MEIVGAPTSCIYKSVRQKPCPAFEFERVKAVPLGFRKLQDLGRTTSTSPSSMKELWRTASRLSQHSQETEQTSSGLERTVSQNDPLASANQAAGLGWLAGHLNHLTPEQEAKLTAFKERCREKGYYTSGEDGAEPSHHDATLLYVLYGVGSK